jgi:hypothetical protein
MKKMKTKDLERRNKMNRWLHKVEVKHLLTEEEDYESISKSMNDIADVLSKEECFKDFESLDAFKDIPADEYFDYANCLLDEMYDYADANRIWIG